MDQIIQLSLLSTPLDFSTKKLETMCSPVSATPQSSSEITLTVEKPKSASTRPFKAYPKDPLTFQAVGLYGLPLHVLPGTPESIIHQQSNHAYTEFRRQMLSQQQVHGKPRRLSQQLQHHPQQLPQPQQMELSPPTSGGNTLLVSPTSIQMQQFLSQTAINLSTTEFINQRIGLIEQGGGVTSSGGEDSSQSNSDEGSSNDRASHNLNNNGHSGSEAAKSEQQLKDDAYWERRRKNNEAAKRSRDARRAKEDEIAIRAAFLEQENLKLRFEVCALKSEVTKLRSMMMFKP